MNMLPIEKAVFISDEQFNTPVAGDIYGRYSVLIAGLSLIFGIRHRSFLSTLVGMFFAAIVWLWTKFCLMFLMWSNRQNEYDADRYSFELGYGIELAKGLDAIGGSNPQKSFLKALYSTHPHTHDRIGRLQQMGVRYYRY